MAAPAETRGHAHELETSTKFTPRFGADGLIPAIVTDAGTGEVVMFAWMNAEALDATLRTGMAHYWSRSRKELWRKGATSGNEQSVIELRVDCDQDALWLSVETRGDGVNCHTGARSCFYRVVEDGTGERRLVFTDGPSALPPG
jgi:phosphoribosyl-AMP cyclohydrolase